jgi:hypothetical protein
MSGGQSQCLSKEVVNGGLKKSARWKEGVRVAGV